jgi:hypothetical protein
LRVLILAFDALEYDLVVKWRLKQLMQMRYGKYEAAKSPRYGKPHTPSAWMTIITGVPPEVHGIDDWWTYGRILDWLRTKPPFVWIKNKRRILWKLGLRPRILDKRDIRVKTIFDLTPKSIALFIPGYSEPTIFREKLNDALHSGVKEYIKTIWWIHEVRKREFFKRLDKDWELFMAWFDIADLLGHTCIVKCRLELFKAYLDLVKIVNRAKKMLDDEVFILIMSDHGMKPMPDGTGDHSDHGFWSINRDWEWFNPVKATDFYPLVKKVLEM